MNGKLYCVGQDYSIRESVILEYDNVAGAITRTIRMFDVYGNALNAVNAKLVQAADGKLYGVSSNGAYNNNACIYSYSPGANSIVIEDSLPLGSVENGLMLASNGKLYGMMIANGANAGGIIYEYNISSHAVSTVFDLPTSANPDGVLTEGSPGMFYGETSYDGLLHGGTLFRYTLATGAFDVLHNFDFNGNFSRTPILATDSKIYGATGDMGNSPNAGTLFSYDLSSQTYSDIYDCTYANSNNGSYPGDLFQASDGKIYGSMTEFGTACTCGTLFQYSIDDSVFKVDLYMDTINATAGTFIEYRPWIGSGISDVPVDKTNIYGKTGAVAIDMLNPAPAYVSIINLLGQEVVKIDIRDASVTIPVSPSDAIYIVRLTQGSSQVVKKVFVR